MMRVGGTMTAVRGFEAVDVAVTLAIWLIRADPAADGQAKPAKPASAA